MRIAFDVDGKPKGKERPRMGPGGVVYTPTSTEDAEEAIADLARKAMAGQPPATGPIGVWIEAVFATPQSWPKAVRMAARRGEVYHVSKPDKDNIEKLVFDALKDVAWHDDSQIADGRTRKRYGATARLEIIVATLAGVSAPHDDPATVPKSPATARLEAKARAGHPSKPRRRRRAPRACELPAIGKRTK